MLLRQLLYRRDIKILPVIASFWLRLQTMPNYEELIRILCERMLDPVYVKKMLDNPGNQDLTEPLKFLIDSRGQSTLTAFESVYGSLRVAGTEKILREKLWQNPVSTTERLWFRGLIFLETRFIDGELRDCFIIPDDLLDILKNMIPNKSLENKTENQLAVRPAIPSETAFLSNRDDNLIDNVCIASALFRDGRPLVFPGLEYPESYIRFMKMLIREAHFFDDISENNEKIRNFLIQNRAVSKIELIRYWRNSETYNEINETNEINVLSSPAFKKSDPRNKIINYLYEVYPDTWISINGFIEAIKKIQPDFLRGSFDEEHGLLTDADGNDLSGLGSWFQLEGAYINFLLQGPLRWLGIVQLAFEDKAMEKPSAFRISKEMLFFLIESEQETISEEIKIKPNLESAFPTISKDGAITNTAKVPRYFRYMALRYSDLEKIQKDTCIYRITPLSLANAEKSGLSKLSLLKLLQRFSNNKVPPSLKNMLSSNEGVSVPATIYSGIILTVPDKEVLDELMSVSRFDKWILQQINPTSVLIEKKGIPEIRRFLMEKEIFVDIQID